MEIADIATWTALMGELGAFLGIIVPMIASLRKITNGQRCQLRNDMLQIYYHCRESGKIRQYEFENFIMLYEAYKALKGNSFIDKIYKEVCSWEIIP